MGEIGFGKSSEFVDITYIRIHYWIEKHHGTTNGDSWNISWLRQSLPT